MDNYFRVHKYQVLIFTSPFHKHKTDDQNPKSRAVDPDSLNPDTDPDFSKFVCHFCQGPH
jgi:hypothetical protein